MILLHLCGRGLVDLGPLVVASDSHCETRFCMKLLEHAETRFSCCLGVSEFLRVDAVDVNSEL